MFNVISYKNIQLNKLKQKLGSVAFFKFSFNEARQCSVFFLNSVSMKRLSVNIISKNTSVCS
jgi:hypothetical protein